MTITLAAVCKNSHCLARQAVEFKTRNQGDSVADAKWQKLSDGVSDRLNKMVEAGRSAKAFMTRNVFPRSQEYQMVRWASEDSGGWAPLNEKYAAYKKIKYAAFPGGGTKTMIATGELMNSVLVKAGSHGAAIFTDTGINISINGLKYASFANEKRNFTSCSPVFILQIKQDLATYMSGGASD